MGYVPITQGHYIENTGDGGPRVPGIFKSRYFADMSLAEWIAHTPKALVMSHLKIDAATYDKINNQEVVTIS